MIRDLRVKHKGLVSYTDIWLDMKRFTDARSKDTPDELWLLQHYPVFTLGQAGKPEHILAAGDIPIVQSDRGGQVTYHGPGQLIVYLLFDIRRLGITVRALVSGIELSIVNLLQSYNVQGRTRKDAPGVYVGDKKIAALGLRVRRGCSFHGLSLNVNMDAEPFTRINPCGFSGLEVTQLKDLEINDEINIVEEKLLTHIQMQFGYTSIIQNGG